MLLLWLLLGAPSLYGIWRLFTDAQRMERARIQLLVEEARGRSIDEDPSLRTFDALTELMHQIDHPQVSRNQVRCQICPRASAPIAASPLEGEG